MLFERFYDEDLAQASYVIACQRSGEAIVVDPRRDIDTYLDFAESHDLRIVAATETHIHADYLSGTRELGAATGATVYLSGEGGTDWTYGFDGELLRHGDTITLGNITIEAVHTPGHTPEHLSFLVTDGALTTEPGYILTGDFVFVGDLGRPDLVDEVAGGEDTRYEGAEQIFASLRDHFLTLPDHVQVWPAHGAGSPCGKSLGAVPVTTVGYERRNAWWSPYLAEDDVRAFTDELLDGQPDAPAYFGRMKRENRDGPALLGELGELREFTATQAVADGERGELAIVDPRSVEEVHAGTLPGSLHVPASTAATHGAWAIDPERDSRPIAVIGDAECAARVRDSLLRIGVDTVSGYVPSLSGAEPYRAPVITPAELDGYDHAMLLDVRAVSEYEEGHIPEATQLHGGRVLWNLEDIPEEGTIVTYCRSGNRSSIAASALRDHGRSVVELEGGYPAWADLHQN